MPLSADLDVHNDDETEKETVPVPEGQCELGTRRLYAIDGQVSMSSKQCTRRIPAHVNEEDGGGC